MFPKNLPNTPVVETLTQVIANLKQSLEEVWTAHCNPKSHEFNDCGAGGDCLWCEHTKRDLADLESIRSLVSQQENALAQLKPYLDHASTCRVSRGIYALNGVCWCDCGLADVMRHLLGADDGSVSE